MFKREFFVLNKQYLLKLRGVFCEVKKEMGKRPRLVIGGTKQDLIANKENISEFTMAKDSMKKKSLKNNVTAKREKISTKYNNNEAKIFSQIKQNKLLDCTYQKSQIPENAIVVLERCDEKAISVAPDVTLKDSYKAKNSHYKLKNILSRCECHSNLLLKDAVVVLERLDENSVTLFKVDGKAKEVPNKTKKGTKRKIEEKSEDTNTSKSKKARKQKDSNDTKSTKKEKIPDVSALDFSNASKSPSGETWNFKISSWNINGIRAWLEKDGISYLHHEQPDILCIQETKCSDDKLPDEMKNIEGYHTYWLAGDKEGYSGVGLLTKEKPIKVDYGIGISEHDNEGRVITAEYEKFYLVSTYVPNAGRGLVRLDYRMKWDKDFREYLKKLDAKKPIILTGDLNVAHEEIDLANPKSNKRNAGFTKEEREGFSALLKEGFIDSFRHLYPNVKGAYTFWTYMMNARAKNVGWRLDYFVISERFTENLCDSVIRKDVFGSDHCPITLFLSL